MRCSLHHQFATMTHNVVVTRVVRIKDSENHMLKVIQLGDDRTEALVLVSDASAPRLPTRVCAREWEAGTVSPLLGQQG